ncbi:hypothetical protein SAMN05443287_11554 [Micromonospora phaseoli]|uniref:Uncharacterized protein n=1 Tax=Micromonospora phaseoli TaxID=1144548 RepID=A0A1H7DMF1_9ACTN|nr:hypothetical protein CLV64_11555 [Micromonospora phaseoli]GIJ80277.1 hypothetical protein Xph01_47090 [Micromonospora phaseoli]SEK02926.1 hypothetical protein SAMN05443287_11554 [Micromonospora phaseoli]
MVQDTRALTLTFEVSGLPPVKTEALSIFAAGHRQATRVRTLLQAACAAAQQTGWTPLSGPIEIDLILRCPPGHRTSDASTLLGGVCAVLQDKKRVSSIGLTHLGVLVDVAIYDDDKQIRKLSYQEEPAEDFSYQVRVAAVPQRV